MIQKPCQPAGRRAGARKGARDVAAAGIPVRVRPVPWRCATGQLSRNGTVGRL